MVWICCSQRNIKEIIKKLNHTIRATLEDPLPIAKLDKFGFKEAYRDPNELVELIRSDFERLAAIAKAEGIIIK